MLLQCIEHSKEGVSPCIPMPSPFGARPLDTHLQSAFLVSLSPLVGANLVRGAPVKGAELCIPVFPWTAARKGHLVAVPTAAEDLIKVGWTVWKKRSERKK